MSKRKYRAGMDAARIVRAATVLTHKHGLDGWSLRQLTSLLNTSPSVVFHHLGDRAALSEAVVSRLSLNFQSADPHLNWSEWVRGTAAPLRTHLAPWPGVADWLLTNGPIFPHMMRILDDGVGVLQRDGFGDESAVAYATLYAATIGAIAQSQLRRTPGPGADPAHHALARRLDAAGESPGAVAMRDILAAYTGDPENAEKARSEAYEYLIDRLIDGLRSRLSEVHPEP